MATNPVFRLKLLLIAAAMFNAARFHRGPFKEVMNWNQNVATPATVKGVAILSLVLWAGVIACGRLLAYF